MAKTYDKPIEILKNDEETETWKVLYNLHARVNTKKTNEEAKAGAIRSTSTKTFEVRYFNELEELDCNTESYRIVYKNHTYNLVGYDDYMQKHASVRLTGELCNG